MSFLNENEIDSQSDDSGDEEYKPTSELDVYSGEEPNSSYDEVLEVEQNGGKKTRRDRNRKGRKKIDDTEVDNDPDNNPVKFGHADDENKEHSDALWADFLSDTNGKKLAYSEASSYVSQSSDSLCCEGGADSSKSLKETMHPYIKSSKQTVHQLEKAIARNDPSKPSASKPAARSSGILLKRPAGGIYSILGQLNKKNKLTVLESSKEDWESFKTIHGLNEDLRSFNKGKDGYLEKQDFLERTDLRQFEIEKDMRQGRGNK